MFIQQVNSYINRNQTEAIMNLMKMTLNINGADRMFICDPEKDTLASVLRRLGLTGTKVGCGTGVCGACSVILDGKVIRSCTRKIKSIKEYSSVITIEGIGTALNPHPLQYAWVNLGAVQCLSLIHICPRRPTRRCSSDTTTISRWRLTWTAVSCLR